MEQGVAYGILGAVLTGGFAMYQFLRLKLGDVGRQFRVIVAKLGQLLRIMAVDFRLDGIGAGHCSPLAYQRCCGTKRESRNTPQGLQRGRADPSVGHQPVETFEMASFLCRHAGNLVSCGGAPAKDCQLPGIDSRRAIFTGLIDAQH